MGGTGAERVTVRLAARTELGTEGDIGEVLGNHTVGVCGVGNHVRRKARNLSAAQTTTTAFSKLLIVLACASSRHCC